MADLLINGIDTEALGFRVARPAGQDDGASRDWSELQGMGLFGAVISAVRVTPRELQIGMWGKRTTPALMREALRHLDWAIAKQDPCELVFGNATGIRCMARYRRRPTDTPERGAWSDAAPGRFRQFVLEFLMESPYFEDASLQTVSGITSTPVDLPMGNAAVQTETEISGPATNPVLTLRDSGATTVATFGLTATLAGSGNKRIIDHRLQTVVDENGDNKISEWTSGDFLTVLPAYFDPRASDWATLAISSGSAVDRHRRTYTVPG